MSGGGASPILGAMPIRIVLADDSFIVREGMHELLKSVDELEIVAVCSDLDSLRAAIEREHPDVVLTDIRMPPTNTDEGIRMAAGLRESAPKVGVVVLSQYADAEYALALLDKGAAGRLHPDLVLMDVHLPGIDGLEASRQIRAEHPKVAVLLLSTYDPEEFANRMATSGAFAFISKGAFGPDRLAEAWTRASSG